MICTWKRRISAVVYENFFDDEDAQNSTLDLSQLLGSEDAPTDQECVTQNVLEKKESGQGSSDADVTDFDTASKYPLPQKNRATCLEPCLCSTFIFFPVPNKGRRNPAIIFRFGTCHCRYDKNIKHDSSSGKRYGLRI